MSWQEAEFSKLHAEDSRNGVYKSKEFHGTGVRVVNMGELFGFDRIGDQPMNLLQLTDREMEKSSLLHGDLLFGRRSLVEEGAGKCSLVYKPTLPLTFESSIIRVRLNQESADPEFYYYYFKSPVGRSRVMAIVNGVTVKGIRGSELKRILVHKPPMEEQVKIRTVLSAYDDLIAANQRRIQLLEESARLLYREWFVKLRFPGHETVPVTDGVPEGWNKKALGDYVTLNYGKGLKETDRSDGEVPVYGSSGIVGHHNKALINGPAIIVGRKGNVGSVYYSHCPCFPIDTVYFISSEQTSYFLYLALQGMNFISSDAAVPGLNRNYAYSQHLLIPSPEVFSAFESRVQPVYEQTISLTTWNERLREARDMLLPKLMSGALDVSRITLPEEATV